jgi:hypothetical protein
MDHWGVGPFLPRIADLTNPGPPLPWRPGFFYARDPAMRRQLSMMSVRRDNPVFTHAEPP